MEARVARPFLVSENSNVSAGSRLNNSPDIFAIGVSGLVKEVTIEASFIFKKTLKFYRVLHISKVLVARNSQSLSLAEATEGNVISNLMLIGHLDSALGHNMAVIFDSTDSVV